ncbi:unnamed protein product [Gemmata massiliana]|uniref:Uncharacterized protein n=1 Tax=Gemmata massiliana TaxID=1210884 RepID=A0A6P2DJT9_9BACT|nr:unnamed protein product [Gemmata massiliana]
MLLMRPMFQVNVRDNSQVVVSYTFTVASLLVAARYLPDGVERDTSKVPSAAVFQNRGGFREIFYGQNNDPRVQQSH